MNKISKKAITEGVGEMCPKCGDPMERRKHPEGYFNKESDQTYYFSEWDYCRECLHIQHYEKFKRPYKNSGFARPIQNLFSGLRLALENNKRPSTLFDIEPSWEKLKEDRCPICGNKLIIPLNKGIALCKGKSHGDRKPFVIKLSTLTRLAK